jgi:hypothetical protein
MARQRKYEVGGLKLDGSVVEGTFDTVEEARAFAEQHELTDDQRDHDGDVWIDDCPEYELFESEDVDWRALERHVYDRVFGR